MVAIFGSSVLLFSLCTSVYGEQVYDFKSEWFRIKPYAPRQAPLSILILQPLNHRSINMDPQEVRAAMLYGWQKFKNLNISRRNYDLNPKYFYLEDSVNEPTTLNAILRRSRDQDIQVFDNDLKDGLVNLILAIGIHTNPVCRFISNLYSAIDVSLISVNCNSVDFNDKNNYPLFARLIGSYEGMIDVIIAFLKQNSEWERFCILSLTDYDQERMSNSLRTKINLWRSWKPKLTISFTKLTHTCEEKQPMNDSRLFKEITELLSTQRTKSNIYILIMYDCEVITSMVAARKLGMLDNPYIKYAFITRSFINALKVDRFWPGNEKYIKETIEGLISINIARPAKSFPQFEKKLRYFVTHVLPRNPNFSDLTPEERNLTIGPEVSVYSGLIFDAIMMLGKAIVNLTRNGASLTSHREDIAPQFFHKYSTGHRSGIKTEEEGATGPFFLDKYKDRVTDYAVEIINDAELKPMFTYYFTEYINNPQDIKLKPVAGTFKWPGNQSGIPSGFPVCGFGQIGSWDDPNCSGQSSNMTITKFFEKNKFYFIGVLIFLLMVVMFYLLSYLRMKMKETKQKSIAHWLIRWKDIITEAKKDKCDGTIRKILYSQAEKPKIVRGVMEKEFFTQVAFFKGLVVCITHVDCAIDKTSAKFIYEMKQMRNLRHENLNQFIGVCPTPPSQCIVTLYAKYGSLRDVIADELQKITLEFKLSFLIDTSSGMEYLHTTSLGHHGHFSSSNVVIDSKWTCKITDFGMSSLQSWKSKTICPADMLYRPPEYLRLRVQELGPQTKQQLKLADIYAYGIIMQELALRDVPFAIERKRRSLVEVINKLTMHDPTVPFRPNIPKGTVSPAWLLIMTQCWHEDPNERPTFKQISQAIRRIAKGKTIYIIDIMLEKLEKQTVKMEKLVAIRKSELNEKQQEVEKLLFNILPESTARSLLKQNFVEPEYFEAATIYFSDLVGFTKICQNSTPYQVVAFLNGAYSVFDDVTNLYNVYKCETIRDVYMVASGLPTVNLVEHAPEAATMALHLLSTVTTFKIPHRPADSLQLRIGLHSGPVVAGVVGIRMPHYCLFGDTVNTASRMQTSGLALQIHISSTTANLLQKTKNFFIDKGGEMQIKGKGLMTTFWLRGKRGFRQPLPDLSLAAPLEDHYFK